MDGITKHLFRSVTSLEPDSSSSPNDLPVATSTHLPEAYSQPPDVQTERQSGVIEAWTGDTLNQLESLSQPCSVPHEFKFQTLHSSLTGPGSRLRHLWSKTRHLQNSPIGESDYCI